MKALWIGLPVATLMLINAGQIPAQEAQTGEALAKRSGCLECHSVDATAIGPAYRDIAERYKDDPDARDALIEKVKNGGKGNWTEVTRGVPMPPHSARLSEADIARLVDWVLDLESGEQ